MKPLAHMAPFFSRFPELAARETRTVKLLEPFAGLPAGEYGFLDLYCNEPTCDCRRVLFQVCRADRPNKVLATINYGWESEDFYAKWLHGDRESARELASADLDPLNTQSKLSPALSRQHGADQLLSLTPRPFITSFWWGGNPFCKSSTGKCSYLRRF